MLLNDGFGERPLPEPPYEWVLSRICEEFPAYTIETAAQAWDDDPVTIGRILQLRAFAAAKAHIDHATDWDDLKMTDAVRQYMRVEAEYAAARHAAKGTSDE